MKKISFFWAYCYNNIWDDLFFYVIFSMLKRQHNDNFKMDILSSNPKNTYWDIKNINYIYSLSILQVIQSLYTSEYLIIGPGSMFTSVTTYRKQNVYILWLSILARILWKKITFLWIDFVPIDNAILRYLALFSLFLSEKIYIRFEDNFNMLKKIPLLSSKLYLVNDLVFSEFFTKIFFEKPTRPKYIKKVWIVLSDLSYFWNNNIVEKLYIEVIEELTKRDFEIDFLILNNWISQDKDLKYINKFLSEKISLKKDFGIVHYTWNWTIENIINAIDEIYSYSLLISNKLHSSIISSIIWTSFFSFSYHEKMRSLNQTVWLHPDFNFDVDKINDANFDEYIRRFETSIEKMEVIQKLNYNFDNVQKIVRKNQIILESIIF